MFPFYIRLKLWRKTKLQKVVNCTGAIGKKDCLQWAEGVNSMGMICRCKGIEM